VNIAQTRNAADGTQQVTGFLGLSTQIGVPQNPTVLIQTYTRSELLQSGSDDIKVDVPNTGNVLSINKNCWQVLAHQTIRLFDYMSFVAGYPR